MTITEVEVRDVMQVQYAQVIPQQAGLTIIGGDNDLITFPSAGGSPVRVVSRHLGVNPLSNQYGYF